MRTLKKGLRLSIAAMVIVAAAPNAFAAASKAMSGAACVPEDFYDAGYIYFDANYDSTIITGSFVKSVSLSRQSRYRSDETGITNTSTVARNFTCDLVRDNSTNTTKPVDVYVRVTDADPARGFQCQVYSCTHLGSSCQATAFGTSENFTGTESINAPVPKSFFNGYYTVTCSVPRNSTIHSLYVYEPD